VSIWDIDGGLAESSAASLAEQGLSVEARQVDITDRSRVREVSASVAAENGPIDGLVNCAIAVRRGRLEDISDEYWDATLSVGLKATFVCSQIIGREMLVHRRGAIVNIASVSAWNPQPLLGSYSACKAGVIALTQQTALEWGSRGVRCNAVSPGHVRTQTSEAVYSIPELYAQRQRLVPVDRIGTPSDMGNAVAFLLSDEASYVNGINLTVDGGFTLGLVDNMPSVGPDGSILEGPISRTSPVFV
jgi:NAD(P)-dependent dehydrogenase (short-subunit alcohol dehydrogenase family)